MHGLDEPELDSDERKAVRKMLDSYDKSRWLGGLLWKVAIGIGGLVAFFATLKGQIISLLKG